MNLAMEMNRIVTSGVFADGKVTPRLRVGIEVGPVVAGIIGRKKFSYDCTSSFLLPSRFSAHRSLLFFFC